LQKIKVDLGDGKVTDQEVIFLGQALKRLTELKKLKFNIQEYL